MKNLLQGCRSLKREDQRKMVDHLSPMLFPVCLRYSDQKEDAKDLLQESLILIFNNIDQFSSNEIPAFKSWCRKITVNAALAKKRKKGLPIVLINEESIAPSLSPNVQSKLNVEDILNLLKQLPQNHQIVFNLAVMDGYSHKEISDILKIPESSSRTFLSRARSMLQGLIYQQEKIKKI